MSIPNDQAAGLRTITVDMGDCSWTALQGWPEATPEQRAEALRHLNAAAAALGATWHLFRASPTGPGWGPGPELD
jgi:hypothetical protein